MVEFTPLGKKPFLKKDWIATTKSLPTVNHVSLKNSHINPSGPEDLLIGIHMCFTLCSLTKNLISFSALELVNQFLEPQT